MTFRQMIYRAKTSVPLERWLELNTERLAWQRKAHELQKEYNKRPVIITDDLTGEEHCAGMEDTGITPFGWSKYKDTPYLVPTRSPKGAAAKLRLEQIGKSPAMIKIMAEEFDIPPYFRDGAGVYYPGFEVVGVFADERGPEGYDPGDLVDQFLFVFWNVYAPEPWDGGEHFEQVSMGEFYTLKGF